VAQCATLIAIYGREAESGLHRHQGIDGRHHARSLAREVGRVGVKVNAVAPVLLDTETTQGLIDEERAKVARRSALWRLAAVGDVADAVEFLLGDKAGSITGTVLTVDAGSTA
jgi:3-oxoacyl-[acyl-carrier protein] reductase